MPVSTENSRWKFGSMAYTVLLLAFFFAVGLAGGVLYRLLPTTNSNQVVAHDTTPSPASSTSTQTAVSSSDTAVSSASPTKAPPAPAKVVAAHPMSSTPPASTIASAPIPTVPPATMPPEIAPIAANLTPEAAPFAPASDQAASMPALAKPAPALPGTGAAPPLAAAKPKLALVKPKALPKKPPTVATAASSLSGSAVGPVRVQFGAFAIEDNAHRVQWTVEATGLAVEVTRLPSPKGHLLYYVRSQPFPDREAALSAATAAQDKAKNLVNPVAIEYIILPEAATSAQQAQAPGH